MERNYQIIAVDWCRDYVLEFDAINDDVEEVKENKEPLTREQYLKNYVSKK